MAHVHGNFASLHRVVLLLITLLLPSVLPAADGSNDPPAARIPEQLRPFNALVGEWRGVGQLQRGSRTGAWTEKANCAWSFDQKSPAVVIRSDRGRQFTTLKLEWDATTKELVLRQMQTDRQDEYRGAVPKSWPGRIQLTTKTDESGHAKRITLQQLNDIRMTLLFEKRTSPTGRFRRVAGVGYTRSGTQLAAGGSNQRKCIVTGGLGTIAVKHQDRTYYVCCSGCRQAFLASPEEFIADFKAQQQSESSAP